MRLSFQKIRKIVIKKIILSSPKEVGSAADVRTTTSKGERSVLDAKNQKLAKISKENLST
jgi:hypothetical protein